MTNEKREALIPPIKCLDEEKDKLELASEADRLPLSTWLRNLGLSRYDDLVASGKIAPKRRASR